MVNSNIAVAGQKSGFCPGNTRIFAGSGFSALKLVYIDRQLNFVWKNGKAIKNQATDTRVMLPQSFDNFCDIQ